MVFSFGGKQSQTQECSVAYVNTNKDPQMEVPPRFALLHWKEGGVGFGV